MSEPRVAGKERVARKERVALVTGGSAGIGRAIAQCLLDADYEVVSLDLQPAQLAHPRLQHVAVDLSDSAATAQAAAEVVRTRAVTTLVHNAGIIRPALLPDVKLDDFNTLVNLHLSAAILLLQAALPAMQAAKFGRVVLISTRAVLGLPTRTSYSATKSGMLGMARTWALELAPQGITVNVIAPGPIQTANFHGIVPEGSPQIDRIIQSIPVKRLGQADDVARAAMFFADPAAGFVTGQVLYVCGGTSVGSLTL
jgi:3-oxoacyl-[acyl-carrier protein] reductase